MPVDDDDDDVFGPVRARAALPPSPLSPPSPSQSQPQAARPNAMFLSGVERPRQPPQLTLDGAHWPPSTPPLASSSTAGSASGGSASVGSTRSARSARSLALSPALDTHAALAHARGALDGAPPPFAPPFTFEYGSRPASTPSRYRPLPSLADDDGYFTRERAAPRPKPPPVLEHAHPAGQSPLARAATIHAAARRPSRTADEGEWTFQGPVVAAIHARLRGLSVGPRFAHYGCAREVPNELLVDLAGPGTSLAIQCPPDFDVRALRRALLRRLDPRPAPSAPHAPHASRHHPLVAFVLAAFGEPCAAPGTVDFGVVGDYLDRVRAPPPGPHLPADAARAELAAWLAGRADEIVPGGLLVAALAVDVCPDTPAASPPAPVPVPAAPPAAAAAPLGAHTRALSRRAAQPARVDGDTFRRLAAVVHLALQQMVGLGRLSAAVASAFRNGPGIARRPADVRAALAASDAWAPLPPPAGADEWAALGVEVRRVDHPAWTCLQERRIDEAEYGRQVAQYVRYVHHDYIRDVLKQKGVASPQEVIEEIFHIVTQRCEEGQLNALHMHVGVMILRRR